MGNWCIGGDGNRLDEFIVERNTLSPTKRKSSSALTKADKGRQARYHRDMPDILFLSMSDYHKVSYLYEGCFGTVFSAAQVNGNGTVALKCFGYSACTPVEEDIRKEVCVLSAMKGVDGIVQIQGVIMDPPQGLIPGKKIPKEFPIIVTEFLGGGDLYYYMHRNGVLSEKKISDIFRGIILALDGFHSRGYIHRYVTPPPPP